MTDRDFFAAQIAATLTMARNEYKEDPPGSGEQRYVYDGSLELPPATIAAMAYDVADALILERMARADRPRHLARELEKIANLLKQDGSVRYAEFLEKIVEEKKPDVAAEMIAQMDEEPESD